MSRPKYSTCIRLVIELIILMGSFDVLCLQGSTCLVEACRNRDMGMIDLLIKFSARDDDCKALSIALRSGESQ